MLLMLQQSLRNSLPTEAHIPCGPTASLLAFSPLFDSLLAHTPSSLRSGCTPSKLECRRFVYGSELLQREALAKQKNTVSTRGVLAKRGRANEADGGNRFNTRWQSTAACGAAERRADGSNQFDAFFKDTTNPGSVNFSPKLQQPLAFSIL